MRIILALLMFTSCSLFKGHIFRSSNSIAFLKDYKYYSTLDYVDQLQTLGDFYISTPGISLIKIPLKGQNYLFSIYKRMQGNNELLFKNKKRPVFYILKSNIPFYFSLPSGKIFISLSLIKKYIRNEGDLVSILAYEFIKSYRNLYRKNIVVPRGFISTERIISLLRIPLVTKIKINRLAFYVLEKAGYDPYSYLIWIQQQNRNTLDFVLHLGDIQNMIKEEYFFKSFLIGKKYIKLSEMGKNSSKKFYEFMSELKRIKI